MQFRPPPPPPPGAARVPTSYTDTDFSARGIICACVSLVIVVQLFFHSCLNTKLSKTSELAADDFSLRHIFVFDSSFGKLLFPGLSRKVYYVFCYPPHADINECVEAALERLALCREPQLCQNTLGSFSCVCPPGTVMVNSTCEGMYSNVLLVHSQSLKCMLLPL